MKKMSMYLVAFALIAMVPALGAAAGKAHT